MEARKRKNSIVGFVALGSPGTPGNHKNRVAEDKGLTDKQAAGMMRRPEIPVNSELSARTLRRSLFLLDDRCSDN
jgi:hypothetical protein